MTETAVLVFLGLVGVAVVYAIVARAGRRNDRQHAERQELEALSRIHERSRQ